MTKIFPNFQTYPQVAPTTNFNKLLNYFGHESLSYCAPSPLESFLDSSTFTYYVPITVVNVEGKVKGRGEQPLAHP
jgi:hypothetical protein